MKGSHMFLSTVRTVALLWFGGITFLVPFMASAENPSPSSMTEQLLVQDLSAEFEFMKEETVVTALRHEQPISEAPSNIYVITAEDIRQSGATDIPTILRRVPGIEVMQVSGADFNVSTRGNNRFQSNKLLAMVDGRSIYNDGQGIVLWKALPVTLSEIQQIEVLLGPASVLYGFNAFDGIVNIITKSPGEAQETQMDVGAGEFNTIVGSVIHGGRVNQLGYRVSAGWDQNQTWRDRDALAFRSYKFHASTDYTLSDTSSIQLSGGYVDSNHFDGVLFESSFSQSTTSQGFARLGYEQENFFVRGYWTVSQYNPQILPHPLIGTLFSNTDFAGDAQGEFTTNTYNIDTQYTWPLESWARFTSGVNFRHNTLDSNFIDKFRAENRVGMYVQSELTPVSQFKAIAGVRYDLDTFINPTWSPRVSLLWIPITDHTFRATWSIGYRPPTLFETFVSIRQPLITDMPTTITREVRTNRNLRPERIVSYEVGYQGWFFQHRLRIRSTAFMNFIKNLIDTRPDPTNGPGESHTIFVNRGDGRIKIVGWEAGVEFLITPWLTTFANYAYQQYDKNVGFPLTSVVRPTGPQFKVNAGLRGKWNNGVSLELLYHHVDATNFPIHTGFQASPLFGNPVPGRRAGNFNLLNIRAGYWFWKDHAEIAVSAFNALNDRQSEHPVSDTIGSRVMGWLTIKL